MSFVMFFKKVTLYMFIFLMQGVRGMDEEPILSCGVFDLYKDHRKEIFGQLTASHMNSLRKSCKLFSQIFSRSNPSKECLSYGNENIKKEIGAILTVAIHDKQYELVDHILKYNKFAANYGYDFGFSILIYPYALAKEGGDQNMINLLTHTFVERIDSEFNRVDELLVASIARDNDRVKRVLLSGIFTLDDDGKYGEPWAAYVAIDNGDKAILESMYANETFRKKVKIFGHYLLQRSIFSKKKDIFDFLMAGKYCDINVPMKNKFKFWQDNLILSSEDDDYTLLWAILEQKDTLKWEQLESIVKVLKDNQAKEKPYYPPRFDPSIFYPEEIERFYRSI